jgi:ribosomal-protein-alanine N-acetyltransferase
VLCIETPRLTLRDFQEEDWRVVYAMSREPAVTRYQTWLRLADADAAREWVRAAMYHNGLAPRSGYNQAIVRREDGQAIGWIGWGAPGEAAEAEVGSFDFGYALLPVAWGQGYMSEALRAVVDYCFGVLGAQCVRGDCNRDNRASARTMEKAGLTLVDTKEEPNEDGVGDAPTVFCCYYAVTREAWESGRGA